MAGYNPSREANWVLDVVAESSNRNKERRNYTQPTTDYTSEWPRSHSNEVFDDQGLNEYRSFTNERTEAPLYTNGSPYQRSNKPQKKSGKLKACFAFLRKRKSPPQSSTTSSPSDYESTTVDSTPSSQYTNRFPVPDSSHPVDLGREQYVFAGKSAEVLGIIVPTRPSRRIYRAASIVSEEDLPELSKQESADDERWFYPPSTSSSTSTPFSRKREGALKAARKRTHLRSFSKNIGSALDPSPQESSEVKDYGRRNSAGSLYAQDWYDDSASADAEMLSIKEIVDLEKAFEGGETPSKQSDAFEWMKLQAEEEERSLTYEATLDIAKNGNVVVVREAEIECDDDRGIVTELRPRRLQTKAERILGISLSAEQEMEEDFIAPVQAPKIYDETFVRPGFQRTDSMDTFEWVTLQVVDFPTPPSHTGERI